MHTMKDSLLGHKRLLPYHPDSMAPLRRTHKRKRVSFAATPITSIHDSASSCQDEPTWIIKQNTMDTVRSHIATVRRAQVADPHAFNLHCELLATAYTNSVVQGDAESSLAANGAFTVTAPVHSCSHLLGMSVYTSELRGIETFVLSSVAADRMQRRRRHQSTMLKAQVRLSKHSSEQQGDLMRQLGDRLSASSRTFALAVGAADAVAAMVEHHAAAVAAASTMTTRDAVIPSPVHVVLTQHSYHGSMPTSSLVGPVAKRRCMPCKVVPPMA